MQHCRCKVFLDGDRNHEVLMADVTVAEIVVLRAVHGGDAVTDIQPTRMTKTNHAEEFARLQHRYDRKQVKVAELFPGANPKLPVNMKDIGQPEPSSFEKDSTPAGAE